MKTLLAFEYSFCFFTLFSADSVPSEAQRAPSGDISSMNNSQESDSMTEKSGSLMTGDQIHHVKVLGMLDEVDDLRNELIEKHIDCSFVEHQLTIIRKLSLDMQLKHLQSLFERMQKNADSSQWT